MERGEGEGGGRETVPKETASALVAPLRATPVNTVQRIVAIPDRFPQSRVENWNDLLRSPPDPVPTPHVLNTLETYLNNAL